METAAIYPEGYEKARTLPAKPGHGPGQPASRIARLAARWPAAAIALCAVIFALPVFIAPMPAMPDYPAHLATFYLLGGGAKLPLLAHFYRVDWAFVPNLAAEATIPFLAPLLGIGRATALFLGITVWLWIAGAAAVQWALFRRVGIAPLFAGFFAYNANFMWGFFNYCFGAGLALLAFAAWIAGENRRRVWHVPALAAAVLVIYFCHAFAAATLLFLIGCYEITALGFRPSPIPVLRRLGPVALASVPAAVAFIVLKPKGGSGVIGFNLLDTWDDRLSAAVQFCFDRPAWLLLGALVVLFASGVWTKRIFIHPRLRFLLVALLFACAFAPEWAMGGWGVDLRLPAVLGTLAFAAAEFRFGPPTTAGLTVGAVAIAIYCSATLTGNWLYYDARFAEFRAATRALPSGSKIVTVLDGDAMGMASDQPYWHMAEYAIIDRQAFTPLLFTTVGQHVIRLQPAVERIAARSAEQGSPPDITELDDLSAGNANDDPDISRVFPYLIRFQCHFDTAVVIHLGGKRSPVPDMLELEHAGSFFSLYRVRPDENCTKS
ncbi:MAG: hypothetical protein ACREHF_09495 [Rhizomicrobium sp.]